MARLAHQASVIGTQGCRSIEARPRRGWRTLASSGSRYEDTLADPTIHPQSRVLGAEEIGKRAGRLGLTEDQIAIGAQRKGEELESALLQLAGEVDQDVAAEREIDARKRRALTEVVLPEDGHDADALLDLVGAVKLVEVFLNHLGRYGGQRRGGVDAAAGKRDRVGIEIGREDTDAGRFEVVAEVLGQENRQRIRLFAGRATGAAQMRSSRPRLLASSTSSGSTRSRR